MDRGVDIDPPIRYLGTHQVTIEVENSPFIATEAPCRTSGKTKINLFERCLNCLMPTHAFIVLDRNNLEMSLKKADSVG